MTIGMQVISVWIACGVAFVYSNAIARALARLFAAYPIARLFATDRHKIDDRYIKVGAVLIAIVALVSVAL